MCTSCVRARAYSVYMYECMSRSHNTHITSVCYLIYYTICFVAVVFSFFLFIIILYYSCYRFYFVILFSSFLTYYMRAYMNIKRTCVKHKTQRESVRTRASSSPPPQPPSNVDGQSLILSLYFTYIYTRACPNIENVA